MDIGVCFAIVGVSLGLVTACAADSARQPVGVPASRIDRLAKGANVCRWFRFPTATTDAHFASYIGDEEAALMRRMGLRHVRLCVEPKVLMNMTTGMPNPRELGFLDAAIARFAKHDLMTVVDIHNEGRELTETADAAARFVKFWTALAKHLATTDPELVLLELMNEPIFDGKEAEWFGLQERLAAAVRAQAPRHTLMATGPNWGGIDGLRKGKPLADRNVVYSFHCYDPFPFTHQGATWSSNNVKALRNVPYPSSPELVAPLMAGLPEDSQQMLTAYGNERWNRAKLADRFGQAIEWGKTYGVPLYCGEFGVYPLVAPGDSRARWFADFGSILGENRVGWASWGWDEGFGINRGHKDGKIVVDEIVAKSLGLKMP